MFVSKIIVHFESILFIFFTEGWFSEIVRSVKKYHYDSCSEKKLIPLFSELFFIFICFFFNKKVYLVKKMVLKRLFIIFACLV